MGPLIEFFAKEHPAWVHVPLGMVVALPLAMAASFLPKHSSRWTTTSFFMAAVGLLGGGVGLLVLTHHMLSAPILWTVAGLIAAGFIAFIVQALLFFRHRKKPKLDPGLRRAGIALCFILCSLVLAPFFLIHGLAAPRIATAYA